MAPPITYDVDGTQYVAFGGGLGGPAVAGAPTNAKVENAPMMFVFALGGKAELARSSSSSAARPGHAHGGGAAFA